MICHPHEDPSRRIARSPHDGSAFPYLHYFERKHLAPKLPTIFTMTTTIVFYPPTTIDLQALADTTRQTVSLLEPWTSPGLHL